jgi:SAM-dependent methyltransferase
MSSRETDRVKARHERRKNRAAHHKYGALLPHSLYFRQGKERALVRLLRRLESTLGPVQTLKILDIGCGSGADLLDLLRLGCRPENLMRVELLRDRAVQARQVLPEQTRIRVGDAAELELEEEGFHICYQSTVFTSLLDRNFQDQLAAKMWRLVKPGGGILWYDFVYDNPGNPDVRGVSVRRLRELFPLGKVELRRVTLAPPIARRVVKVHPILYAIFNSLPLLRTHVLAWIAKPVAGD